MRASRLIPVVVSLSLLTGCRTVRSELIGGTATYIASGDGPSSVKVFPLEIAMCAYPREKGGVHPVAVRFPRRCDLRGVVSASRFQVTQSIDPGQTCALPVGDSSQRVRTSDGSVDVKIADAGTSGYYVSKVEFTIGADTIETPSRHLQYRFNGTSRGEASRDICPGE